MFKLTCAGGVFFASVTCICEFFGVCPLFWVTNWGGKNSGAPVLSAYMKTLLTHLTAPNGTPMGPQWDPNGTNAKTTSSLRLLIILCTLIDLKNN